MRYTWGMHRYLVSLLRRRPPRRRRKSNPEREPVSVTGVLITAAVVTALAVWGAVELGAF